MKSFMRTMIGAWGVAVSAGLAVAAPINLNSWTAESYPAVTGFTPGTWTVAADGSNVVQSVNGQPAFFLSNFNAQGTKVKGTIHVNQNSADDDFIGFALGFNPGDSSNPTADYLLIDWKRGNQSQNFGAPSASPGGPATSGLAVSRVKGVPDADEFWQHANLAGTVATSAVQELARGSTLGNVGWAETQDYEFVFDFGPNNLRVSVNGVQQFDLLGVFGNGRMGFYNFSQPSVVYSAFEVEPGIFPLPEPDGLLLASLGLAALVGVPRLRRRRR